MRHKYYPEDELIAKLESGEFTWLDYVNHFSEEWQNEYQEYCEENNLTIGAASAKEFVHYKDEQLEIGIANGDA